MLKSDYSELEIKEILKEHLGANYTHTAEKAKVLGAVIKYADNVSNAISLAELLPTFNTFLNTTRGFSFLSNHLGFISVLLFPVGAMIDIAKAYQTGQKLYAYRAVTYTTTAWAYNKPLPNSSPRVISNMQISFPVQPPSMIKEYHEVWRKTASQAIISLKQEASKACLNEDDLKLLFRAISMGNESDLCRSFMEGYAAKLSHVDKIAWQGHMNIPYPH